MSERRELARLVRRARKGDSEAFGQIYDRYYDSVYAYVLRQVGTAADAEDITAGVFLEVLEKLDGFTWRGAGFAAWLFRIARNDVLDHFRRRSTKHREVSMTEETLELPSGVLVEAQAETAWRNRDLMESIDRLSDEQRQVVMLKLLVNFSNRQIGHVLGKSEGAVKALQHRALVTLRKLMQESGTENSGEKN